MPAVGAALIRQDEQPGLRSKQSPAGRSSHVRCSDPVAALECSGRRGRRPLQPYPTVAPAISRQTRYDVHTASVVAARLDLPTANCVHIERRSDVGILRDSSSSLPTGTGGRRADSPRYGWVRRCGERGRTLCAPTVFMFSNGNLKTPHLFPKLVKISGHLKE